MGTAGTRLGRNGRRYVNYDLADGRNLARSRRGLGLERFELTDEQRAARVEAYAMQVARAGRIVAWLPPPAEGLRRGGGRASLRFGRQRRWFDSGRLDGPAWSPAFRPGG